jgi:hypothetical protein
MRLITYIIAYFAILATGCKSKEDPIGYIGKADFYAVGTIDNKPLLIEAGNNNFIMQTENGKDSLYINAFTGSLINNCANCNEKLSITIRNYEVGTSQNWMVDSVFKIGYIYNFYRDVLPPSAYRVFFKNESVGIGNVDYKWDFGDGFGSLSNNPEFIFRTDGKKNIKLIVDFKDVSCISTIETPIYINGNNLNGYIDYTYKDMGNNVFKCHVVNADSSTHKFVWRYLNQTNSFPKGNDFELPAFTNQGVFKVDLLAINKATDDTTFVSKNIATAANTNCVSNFSFSLKPVRDTLQLNKIIVDYTAPDGTFYSSKYLEQFTGFVIKEIINYKDMVSNKKTIKVKVLFTCNVSNGTKIIELKDITSVFAFSY